MEVKRIGYLLLWMLAIGMTLVHLQTLHKQNIYRITTLMSQQQHLEQQIWDQQAALSAQLEVPARVREKVQALGLAVCPPGESFDDRPMVAEQDNGSEGPAYYRR